MLGRRGVCGVLVSLCALVAVAAPPGDRVFQNDAVALIRDGKEIKGDPAFSVIRTGYTYHFSSAENKAAFEKEPAKFEIQLGGACARMGPLSGEGRCDLFAVHEGRLYIFASPQCRDGFLAAPDKLLESDDPPAKGDEAAMKRGRELFDRAVAAHGGAEKLAAVKTYVQRIDSKKTHEGKEFVNDRVYLIEYPDKARDEYYWGESVWLRAVNGATGQFATEKGFDKPMAESQVRAARRELNHNFLAVMKAASRPEFVAVALGPGKVGDNAVERLAVSFDGTTITLGVDPNSGRVRTLAFVGRGGERGLLGMIERTFVDLETIDGVTLPKSWRTTFDGAPQGDAPTTLTRIVLNEPLTAKTFDLTAGK